MVIHGNHALPTPLPTNTHTQTLLPNAFFYTLHWAEVRHEHMHDLRHNENHLSNSSWSGGCQDYSLSMPCYVPMEACEGKKTIQYQILQAFKFLNETLLLCQQQWEKHCWRFSFVFVCFDYKSEKLKSLATVSSCNFNSAFSICRITLQATKDGKLNLS